jgi:hypothetical protein
MYCYEAMKLAIQLEKPEEEIRELTKEAMDILQHTH